MKKILILTLRPLHNGPRIIREINALKASYEMVVVGLSKPEIEGVRFYDVTQVKYSLIDRAIRKIYRAMFRGRLPKFTLPILSECIRNIVKIEDPDIVIVHDPEFLPRVSKLKDKNTFKLVYNAHEYHPLQFDSDAYWLRTTGRLYHWIYNTYLQDVDLMINVCDGIANKCKQEFNKDSLVIPNASVYYPEIKPVFNKGDQIRIIHHGGATRQRKIEYMIEAVKRLGPSYKLDLILVPGEKKYLDELTDIAKSIDNVNIIQPVKFEEIVGFLNKYDIGLFNLPPYTFNYRHALPNKLFEFIQARLCVLISNSIEMKKIVNTYNLGIVSEGHSTDQLYDCLKQIDMETINFHKRKSDEAASQVSAEKYYGLYKEAIQRMESVV